MLKLGNSPFLCVSRYESSEDRLHFRVDVPAGQDLDIQPGKSARLVMDASRPTLLGCRWDTEGAEGESARATCKSRTSLPGHGKVRLTWTLRTNCSFTAELFLLVDKNYYSTEAQVDQEARTIWWPLPAGRSVNGLTGLLGFEEDTLYLFVARWFSDEGGKCTLPFELSDDDVGVSYDETAYSIPCHTEDEAAMDWVCIPDELLRDPIRNGSADPSDGFNPRNEGQKAAIIAHLELELVRLSELFRRDGSIHPSEVPASVA